MPPNFRSRSGRAASPAWQHASDPPRSRAARPAPPAPRHSRRTMKTMNDDDGKTHTLSREEQTEQWKIAKSGDRRAAADVIRDLGTAAQRMRKVAKAANAAMQAAGNAEMKFPGTPEEKKR